MFSKKTHAECLIFIISLFLIFVLPFNFPAQEFDVPSKSKKADFPLKIVWTNKIKNLNNQIASDNINYLFIAFSNEKLSSYNLLSGQKLWESDLGAEIISPPLVENNNDNDGNFYIVAKSLSDGKKTDTEIAKLLSISRKTGITNRQIPLSSMNNMNKAYIFSFDQMLIVVGDDGNAICVKPESAEIVWKNEINKSLSAVPFMSGDSLFVGTQNGEIFKISAGTGQIALKIDTQTPPTSMFVNADKKGEEIFWGNKTGEITSWRSLDRKRLWRIRVGAEVTYLTNTADGLLISSLDNFIYLLSENNGSVLWKKRLADRVTIEPFVLRDKIIVTSGSESTALVLGLKEGKIINQINLKADIRFLSQPVIAGDLLVFSTSEGLVAFDFSIE